MLLLLSLQDINAIFRGPGGLWHLMFQCGDGPPPWGYRWSHKVSADLVRWYPIQDALSRDMTSNTHWDDLGPCDGTVSFPDLGKPPYNGTTPVALYGPDCGVPVKPPPTAAPRASGLLKPLDVARVEVAMPADPSDPYLAQWTNDPAKPGPVTFENGLGCSFAGRVWKSKVSSHGESSSLLVRS